MQTTHFIGGRWIAGEGPEQAWHDPSTGRVAWAGRAATAEEVDAAVAAARRALGDWSARPFEQRVAAMQAFARCLQTRRENLVRAICLDTGKPRWESGTEVDAMVAKVDLSIEAHRQRRAEQRGTSTTGASGGTSVVRFKPYGVVAVLGPFNLPGHLPNGHVVPALLAGNTVVFKPSEQAPLTGQVAAQIWEESGLPAGTLNLIQGQRDTGMIVAGHDGIDGLFFTGSAEAGKAIHLANADRPDKILALEMGGNNPLVAWPPYDIEAAAVTVALSAFITAGQRCTCARRLILSTGADGDQLLHRLAGLAARLRIGPPDAQPEPFMGPLISEAAAQRVLQTQDTLLRRGGRSVAAAAPAGDRPTFLRPGIVDVTAVTHRPDQECFGPLLQVIRVRDLTGAIEEANRTAYGLAAGLICSEADKFDRFFRQVRAGVINWNHQTTGASSRLPFGGVGASGNHRPAGFWSADYCSYPVASMESERVVMPSKMPPGLVG